jgi:DNA repair exonuclease SbcCD ATPase subunit
MHSFHDLEITTLKKICSKYNLHVKIAKYSKLSKTELISHMEKHLMITADGKIKMKKECIDSVEDELSKMIEALKKKVKEVKEKVQKHHTKKETPKEEEKNINIEKKEEKKEVKMKAMTIKQVKEEAKKYDLQLTKKINGKSKSKTKKELLDEIHKCQEKKEKHNEELTDKDVEELRKEHEKNKEKEKPKEEKAKKEEKDDYSHLEPEHRELYKEYHPLHKKVKAKLDELMPFLETLTLITSRRGQPKTEADKLSHYFNIETSDSSKNGIEASVRALKHLDKKLNEFIIQKGFHDIQPKKEKPMMKEHPMNKIDKIQSELHKLEQLIKMDEKENEKEHKKLHEEVKSEKPQKKLYSDINEYKDALKKLYKKKALQYHPDKNVGNEEEAKKKFQALGNQFEKKMKQIEEHEKQQKQAVPQKGQRRKRN